MQQITPDIILNAYANGFFPMADSASSDELYWYRPEMRGILPIDNFHVSKSLKYFIKKDLFLVCANSCFKQVILGCASRDDTWINKTIIDIFLELHELGFAHSVEIFDRVNNQLLGGIYGIALGGAFFGESMFSKKSNASKVALVYLMAHLKNRGYILFDTQYINDHLKQFGCYEISAKKYNEILQNAIKQDVKFYSEDLAGGAGFSFDLSLDLVLEFLQSMSQTSKTG